MEMRLEMSSQRKKVLTRKKAKVKRTSFDKRENDLINTSTPRFALPEWLGDADSFSASPLLTPSSKSHSDVMLNVERCSRRLSRLYSKKISLLNRGLYHLRRSAICELTAAKLGQSPPWAKEDVDRALDDSHDQVEEFEALAMGGYDPHEEVLLHRLIQNYSKCCPFESGSSDDDDSCSFVDPVAVAKCTARSLPQSRFCDSHVLQDEAQVLYRRCPYVSSSGTLCHLVTLNFTGQHCDRHCFLQHSRSVGDIYSEVVATFCRRRAT